MNREPPNTTITTGLTGLIGSELAASLPADQRFSPLGDPRVDITNERAVNAALDAQPQAQALLHLAAFTDTDQAHRERGDREGACYRVNVLGTRNLARACAARGLHLIYSSTDFVFAGDSEAPYTETDSPSPIDWYGETKLWGEEAAMGAASWTIVRLSFPYGSKRHAKDLLGKMLGAFGRGETLRLFDDQRVTPSFTGDIAAGLLRLAEIRPRNEILHLTGSECITPYDFGMAVAEEFGLPRRQIERSRITDLSGANTRPRHRTLCMDNAKWVRLAKSVGLAPPMTLREGLRNARRRIEASATEAGHR